MRRPFAAVADDFAARLDGRLFVADNARSTTDSAQRVPALERRLRAGASDGRARYDALRSGHSLDAATTPHGIARDARHRGAAMRLSAGASSESLAATWNGPRISWRRSCSA